MKTFRILSIDPSVNNVGWALCQCKSKDDPDIVWTWGQINTSQYNYLARCREIAILLEQEVGKPDILVMEWPTFFDSARGHIAAKQGYTIDLAGICGYLAGWWRLTKSKVYLITAVQWKGSVTKAITAKKFYKRFKINPNTLSDHIIDAAMLGEFAINNRIDFDYLQSLQNSKPKLRVIRHKLRKF